MKLSITYFWDGLRMMLKYFETNKRREYIASNERLNVSEAVEYMKTVEMRKVKN
jgi:hypothetical protein